MATCWMLRLDPGSKCGRNRMGALCTIDWFVSVIETSREICTNHAFLRLWDWSSSAQFCHWGKEVKMRAKPTKRWFNQWLMVAEHDVLVVACKWYDIDNTIQYTMVRWQLKALWSGIRENILCKCLQHMHTYASIHRLPSENRLELKPVAFHSVCS